MPFALLILAAFFVLTIGRRPKRWGDHDRYIGPFTIATRDYRKWGLMLDSGDDDDYPGCNLRLYLGTLTLIAALVPILRPWREKVTVPSWRENGTAERLGRDWYWNTHAREFGFSLNEGTLHMHFGRQTHDSTTDRSKCWFPPWRQWRHVRRSFYDLNGQPVAHLYEGKKRLTPEQRRIKWDSERAIEAGCPRVRFHFLDFDNEAIVATCHVEEREWHRGERWFKWLAWITPPCIERSLCLSFSSEVGKRKGSWKGGTLGHSIDMKPGETPEAAFMRYCDQQNLTFAGVTDHYLLERYGIAEKPKGWNVEVLGHFHRGPEARPASSAFSEAFHRRASEPVDPDPSAA